MKIDIQDIGVLMTMSGAVQKKGIGIDESDLGLVEKACVQIQDGKIVYAGPSVNAPDFQPDQTLSANGNAVMPGLVDAHTHLVFSGSRVKEFVARSRGATYQEIAEAGGGINATVSATTYSSENDLIRPARDRAKRMMALGDTCIEVKSGYGLSIIAEIKILRAIKSLNESNECPRLIPTFLGAHAVPVEFKSNPDRYVDLIINEMLPMVKEQGLAEFCDVFCEPGYFTIEQSRKILSAAKNLGFKLKIHADEFEPYGGAKLAAELKATSADHLLAIDDEGIAALAGNDVTAVVLPASSLILRKNSHAPARKMIDAGVRVALATDFNPGSSPCESLPLVASLGIALCKMTVPEALCAVTLNGAYAVGLANRKGAVISSYDADLILLNVMHPFELIYWIGRNMVKELIINGKIVKIRH